jgi:uncharacterized protein YgbK (DUF1537 family)
MDADSPGAGVRRAIREHNRASGRRIAVLDDDPTGSQSVHDVGVVLDLDPDLYAEALAEPGSTCFVVTNTRSMPEPDAVRVTRDAGLLMFALQRRIEAPITVVSRSDSTLRGHLIPEVGALDDARRQMIGRGHDGVLLVPAYIEAGRFTAQDTHWATVGGRAVPVARTEFARDATFGYTTSNLRDLVVTKSAGRLDRGDVLSLSLNDIRLGGADRVAEVLADVTAGRFVIVNATTYDDLETVALGLIQAQEAGRTFLHRCGPSFVRALAGIDPQPPLTAAQLWPQGRPSGHGLLVVGSHVGLTGRQVEEVRRRGGLAEVQIDVRTVLDPTLRTRHVSDVTAQVAAELQTSDVLLLTSRALVTAANGAGSLEVSRSVSRAVTDVVQGLGGAPRWVIAKGGITSHDVAVRGLRIRTATVLGQLLPGVVSVFRPDQAPAEVIGVPFVVFAGNVGDEGTLADVVDLLRGVPSS